MSFNVCNRLFDEVFDWSNLTLQHSGLTFSVRANPRGPSRVLARVLTGKDENPPLPTRLPDVADHRGRSGIRRHAEKLHGAADHA